MQAPDQPRRPLLTQTAHHHLREAIGHWRTQHAVPPLASDAIHPPLLAIDATAPRPLLAIDATAGNGHDTVFLAQLLSTDGEVAAFDIQPQALKSTAARLLEQESKGSRLAKVHLIEASHAEMLERLPPHWRGAVCAITFNLGYLPGGDKACVTLATSTLPALEAALQLLAPGGLLSVLCYRGHAEGASETDSIHHWLTTLPPHFSHQFIQASDNAPPHAPLLLQISRDAAGA